MEGVLICHLCQSTLLPECSSVRLGVLESYESALACVSYVSCQLCKEA